MISKTITAQNHKGEQQERTLYFNLTKAEALEINLMENLEEVGRSENPREIIPVFKRIMRAAYGVKLAGGQFTKDDGYTQDFLASDYYSELLMELLQAGEQGMADFIKGILNFNVEEMKKEQAARAAGTPEPTRPAPQDFLPSAREIAAQNKENNVAQHTDPAEAKRVPNYPSTDTSTSFEESPEYKQFLARRAQEASAEPVNLGNQPIEVHDKPTPAIQSVSDEERTARPPFTGNN